MTENLTADGTTTTYTTEASFVTGTLKVYVDGIRYSLDDDYTETELVPGEAGGFEMSQPVPVGSNFVIDYETTATFQLVASGT